MVVLQYNDIEVITQTKLGKNGQATLIGQLEMD